MEISSKKSHDQKYEIINVTNSLHGILSFDFICIAITQN